MLIEVILPIEFYLFSLNEKINEFDEKSVTWLSWFPSLSRTPFSEVAKVCRTITKFTTYLQKIFNTFMFVLFRESDGQCMDNKGQGIPEGLLFTPGTLKT